MLLWADAALQKMAGKAPKFPLAERRYFLEAVRYVGKVAVADLANDVNSLPENLRADIWAVTRPATYRAGKLLPEIISPIVFFPRTN